MATYVAASSSSSAPWTKNTSKCQRSSERPKDAPSRTPPALTMAPLTTQEPGTNIHPTVEVGSNIASSSTPSPIRWQSTFMLGNSPLPMTASLRNWPTGEGGRIAQSLGQALQLLNNVHYFSYSTDEAVASRLQWHTIAVRLNPCLSLYFLLKNYYYYYYLLSLFLRCFSYMVVSCCSDRQPN